MWMVCEHEVSLCSMEGRAERTAEICEPGSEEDLRGLFPWGGSSREQRPWQGTLRQSWWLSVRDTGDKTKSLFKPFWSLVLYDSKVKQLGPMQAAVFESNLVFIPHQSMGLPGAWAS